MKCVLYVNHSVFLPTIFWCKWSPGHLQPQIRSKGLASKCTVVNRSIETRQQTILLLHSWMLSLWTGALRWACYNKVQKIEGSLRNGNGNANANATNRWFWLVEWGKIIVLHILCASWFNCWTKDDRKFSFLRFWRQCKPIAVNLSFFTFVWKPFVSSKCKWNLLILYNVSKHGIITKKWW